MKLRMNLRRDRAPRRRKLPGGATTLVAASLLAVAAAAGLLAISTAGVARAEEVTRDEARRAAQNYIRYIVARNGAWGEAVNASVRAFEPFVRGERRLGWFCAVDPVGYLIVSPYRELAPIRAYSTRQDLDPTLESGLTGLYKDRLERLFAAIEARTGRTVGPDDDFASVLAVSFRNGWAALADRSFDPTIHAAANAPHKSRAVGMDYQQGTYLLRSVWTQRPPYNDDCPDLGCDWSQYGYFNARALVGCVSTATSQLMRFYNWPPWGYSGQYDDPYDWANMQDTYIWTDSLQAFRTPDGDVATQAEIDAVAELCHEVGNAVDMDYGCGESNAYTVDVEAAAEEQFRYNDGCQVKDRTDYNFAEWFGKLKDEFNSNRPVVYRIPGHAIVVDGWDEEWIGDQYSWIHLNYGWGGTNDGWFSPDEIPESSPDEEFIVCQLRPVSSLGSEPDGTFYVMPDFPFIYVNRDLSSRHAIFEGGLQVPVLRSGCLFTNTGTLPSQTIEFQGVTYRDPTQVYLSHDPLGENRIKVTDGLLRILPGGQMVIH